MWIAVILLCCGMIIVGASEAPKPVGYGLVAIGIVALILTATNWGPRSHVQLDHVRQTVVLV